MAKSSSIDMPLPPITITVRMPRFYGIRLRLIAWCLMVASWIGGAAIVVERHIVEPE